MLLIAISAVPVAALAGWVWHEVMRVAAADEVAPDERLLAAIIGHRNDAVASPSQR
jgi:hypothetical protein